MNDEIQLFELTGWRQTDILQISMTEDNPTQTRLRKKIVWTSFLGIVTKLYEEKLGFFSHLVRFPVDFLPLINVLVSIDPAALAPLVFTVAKTLNFARCSVFNILLSLCLLKDYAELIWSRKPRTMFLNGGQCWGPFWGGTWEGRHSGLSYSSQLVSSSQYNKIYSDAFVAGDYTFIPPVLWLLLIH